MVSEVTEIIWDKKFPSHRLLSLSPWVSKCNTCKHIVNRLQSGWKVKPSGGSSSFSFKWPKNMCRKRKNLLHLIQYDPAWVFFWGGWFNQSQRYIRKNLTPSCEVRLCPRTLYQLTLRQAAWDFILTLSQYTILNLGLDLGLHVQRNMHGLSLTVTANQGFVSKRIILCCLIMWKFDDLIRR